MKLKCSVVGFDIDNERNRDVKELFNIETFDSYDNMVNKNLDALVISVPTDKHAEYYKLSYSNRIPFFSEANIFTPSTEWFESQEKKYGVKSFPSATWKFHPLFHAIKRIIDEKGYKSVNSVFYHYGGYLPYWHPWENYWDYYAGQKKTSAAREMVPFELEWLVYVFGRVKMVSSMNGKMSEWKTDMDDAYYLNLIFENDVFASLIIELHQTNPFRVGRISMKDESLELDMINNKLLRYNLIDDTYKSIKIPGVKVMTGFNFEDIYLKEMESFINAVNGCREYVKTWEEDRHLSDVLFAAEKSWLEKRWINIKDICTAYNGFEW